MSIAVRRLLCVGLDGGDLPFIGSRRAHLPNLDRLLGRSAIFTPAGYKGLNGCSWHNFTTASAPGEHGLYQHLNWHPERMGVRLIDPSWYLARPFWQDLEARGLDVIVADIPYIMPGHLKTGVEVIDWATHGQTLPTTTNRPVAREVLRRHGRSRIGRETPIPKPPARLEKARRQLVESAREKTDFLLDLMGCQPWDLFIGVYAESHRAGHMFFGPGDAPNSNDPETPLLSVYREMDRGIGRIADAADAEGALLMVFSVHGMERGRNQPGLVNAAMGRLNAIFLREHLGLEPSRRTGVVRELQRIVPPSLQLMIAEPAPNAVRTWVVRQSIAGGIDWGLKPGFALRTDVGSDIRLNLKDREAKGMLVPGSALHGAYVDWLERVFLSLEDADSGERLVHELVPTGALFANGRSTALPDFIVTWRDVPVARCVRSDLIGEIRLNGTPRPRGGDHTVDGFALVYGSGLPARMPELETVEQFGAFMERLIRPQEAGDGSAVPKTRLSAGLRRGLYQRS